MNEKKSQKTEQDSLEKTEKQRIKRLEEEIEFLRKSYSEETEEEDDLVKVFVAERNAKGHLQNLGSFRMLADSIDWLQQEIKERYGKGRYCVSLQKGSFRSKGVDILIGAGKRRKQKQDFGTIAGMPQFGSSQNLSSAETKSKAVKDSAVAAENPKSLREERIAKWMTYLHIWWGFVKGKLRAEGLSVTYKDFLDARRKLKMELSDLPEEELKRVYNSHVLEAFEDHIRQICLDHYYQEDDRWDYSDEE